MIAPKQESLNLVKDWLTKELSGTAAEFAVNSDYVTVQASVNVVEKLLKTQYNAFGTFLIKSQSTKNTC